MDEVEARSVTLEVPVYSKERGLARPWPAEYYLAVYVVEKGYVTIEGDPAGLRGLATQLLSLAEREVPAGYAHDLDRSLPAELESGSVPLVLLKTLEVRQSP
jgi:hypothetical protein